MIKLSCYSKLRSKIINDIDIKIFALSTISQLVSINDFLQEADYNILLKHVFLRLGQHINRGISRGLSRLTTNSFCNIFLNVHVYCKKYYIKVIIFVFISDVLCKRYTSTVSDVTFQSQDDILTVFPSSSISECAIGCKSSSLCEAFTYDGTTCTLG